MKRFDTALRDLVKQNPELEVITTAESVAECSHDSWMRSLIRRRLGDTAHAGALLRPSSTAEVSAVLAWAQRSGTAVVPFGLGSGVCGGVLAAPGQVVVDLSNMAEVREINDIALTATVQAGTRGSDFEAELGRRGLTMGHYPQSIDISTVGGWCATRSAGQMSTRYGNIEDMLIGCEVVLAGGQVLRFPSVPRSAAGPNLKELFLGSEGTLGVLTELVFRVQQKPAASRGRCFTLPSLESGIEALRLIVRAGWRPAVTRLYDAVEAGRNFAHVQSVEEPVLLLLSEGPEHYVEVESQAVREIVENHGGIDNGPDPVASWLEHRNEVPTFENLLDQGLVADTIEVAIAWDKLCALFKEVVDKGNALDGIIAMSGHISHCYSQGANIYFTFVAGQSSMDQALALYDRAWELTMETTRRLGGTISHHHGIGRVRKRWLVEELGAGVALLRAMKKALDPKGIMNPGVLIDPGKAKA